MASDETTDRGRPRVAFLVANEGIEQVELARPREAVQQAGWRPALIAPEPGEAQCMRHLDKVRTWPVDRTTADAEPAHYDAVVPPGGVANPDQLRMDHAAVRFVQRMAEAGKPVAAICHGPSTLVEADLVRGRSLTSWPSLRTDIRNAEGTCVDAEVQVCTNGPNLLATSRKPDDLPAFNRELLSALASRSCRVGAR